MGQLRSDTDMVTCEQMVDILTALALSHWALHIQYGSLLKFKYNKENLIQSKKKV